MKYARSVSRFQRTGQSHPYLQRLADPERSVAADPGTERVSTVILHDDVWTSGKGHPAVQYRHDVWVAGDSSHRPLLAVEVFEVDILRIGTEHLHRDHAVE